MVIVVNKCENAIRLGVYNQHKIKKNDLENQHRDLNNRLSGDYSFVARQKIREFKKLLLKTK